MKTFLIGGTIINDSSEAWAFEDTTPAQVRACIAKLEPGEDIVFDISSPGGSVTGGIAIANLIREASKAGHHTKAHVVGIAASMASVIACACDEIEIDSSAFMMIHNPWTVCQGDAEDLRKEAEVLDQMKAAILSFYRSKFDKTDDEITALMDAETWFTGDSAADFGFKASVIASEAPLKAAACARELPSFAKAPEAAVKLFVMGQHSETPSVPVEPSNVSPATTTADGSEPDDEFMFTKRLAAAMKSRDTEINRLKDQLRLRDEELTQANARVTSLEGELESAKSELHQTASALEEQITALATLNAAVNTPSAAPRTLKVNAREHMASLPIGQRAKFYREHRAEVDGNQIIQL